MIAGQKEDSLAYAHVDKLNEGLKMLKKVRNPLLYVNICLNLILSINQSLTYHSLALVSSPSSYPHILVLIMNVSFLGIIFPLDVIIHSEPLLNCPEMFANKEEENRIHASSP